MQRWICLFGATSSIGRALARRWAAQGYAVALAGRRGPEVEAGCKDLGLRFGVPVRAIVCDAGDTSLPGRIPLADLPALHGVVWAWGTLGPDPDPDAAPALPEVMQVNLTAAATVVEALIPRLAPGGFVLLLSSVAGERGRRRNYWYGAAKAGLTVYGQGLRHRLSRVGIRVTVGKLGIVDSQMTWSLPSTRLAADPGRVAARLVSAVERGRAVVYAPAWWRPLMAAVRLIPEPLFNRIDL